MTAINFRWRNQSDIKTENYVGKHLITHGKLDINSEWQRWTYEGKVIEQNGASLRMEQIRNSNPVYNTSGWNTIKSTFDYQFLSDEELSRNEDCMQIAGDGIEKLIRVNKSGALN